MFNVPVWRLSQVCNRTPDSWLKRRNLVNSSVLKPTTRYSINYAHKVSIRFEVGNRLQKCMLYNFPLNSLKHILIYCLSLCQSRLYCNANPRNTNVTHWHAGGLTCDVAAHILAGVVIFLILRKCSKVGSGQAEVKFDICFYNGE